MASFDDFASMSCELLRRKKTRSRREPENCPFDLFTDGPYV
jgi:hypothetical protein